MNKELGQKFFNLEFNSPIVLLSGCVGFGDEYTRVEGFSNDDVGAICLKGTTLEERIGNNPQRIYETESGMINAIGLQNPGADFVIKEILPSLDMSKTNFIANISGSTIDEYVQVVKKFDNSDIQALEINISCPNVKEGGVHFGNNYDMTYKVVEACRKATKKPLIVKLSPNQSDIGLSAKKCIDAGADCLSVINTISAMSIDIEKRKPILDNINGGLSGPAIKPIALLKIFETYQVAKKFNIPIIGQGGINSVNDAIEFILAGSSFIGIGTALFYDPLICPKINKGIIDYMKKNKYKVFSDFVGDISI